MMKALCIAVVAGLLLSLNGLAQNWTTDYEQAKTTAKLQDRAVFLFFTGSDWCGWCKRLDREVLSTPDFVAFARDNLVLVKIDFPRYQPLPPAQQLANEQLSERFNVEGYPTVYVLSKEGKIVGRLGYMQGGSAAFIKQMKSFGEVNWRSGSGGAPSTQPNVANANPGAPTPFNGAQLVAPKDFQELQLTGIMGTKKRPMVMINNHTFEVGETGRVKVKGAEVLITCKEIRPKSALVLLEGSRTPTEIFLASER